MLGIPWPKPQFEALITLITTADWDFLCCLWSGLNNLKQWNAGQGIEESSCKQINA